MKRLLLLPLLLLIAAPGFTQTGARFDSIALSNSSGYARVLAYASVTVCGNTATAGTSSSPCSQPVLPSLYSNVTLSQQMTNPFLADSDGNIVFYVLPNHYQISVCSLGYCKNYKDVSVGYISGDPLALTGGGTISGGWTATLQVLNKIRFCTEVKADGVTDDGSAVNACIADAVAHGYGTVWLPPGSLHIVTAINAVNLRGITLRGAGTEIYNHAANASITELMCDTGTVCLDTAGATSVKFQDFSMRLANTYATPSTVAVIEGRTASGGGSCYSENNRWERVNIWTDFNGGSLNGGIGYIGIYNVGGEARKYDSMYILANAPMVFATTNIYSVTSPYETLQAGCPQSMTVVQMDEMTLSNNGGHAITAATTADFTLNDVVFLNTAANAGHFYGAFAFEGSYTTNWNVTAHVESMQNQNSVISIGSTTFDKNYFNVNVGGSVASAYPYIAFAGAGQTIQDTYFAFDTHNEAGNQRSFISNAAAETVKGGEFWIGGSKSALSATNITLTGTVVHAQGFTSPNVTFATGSLYKLYADDGEKSVGNVGIGVAPSTAAALTIKGSALAGAFQYGLDVGPTCTTAATSQCIGLIARANIPAGVTVGVAASLATVTPTIGLGSTITEYDSLRLDQPPTAGTTCLIKAIGYTSGAACIQLAADSSEITIPTKLTTSGVVNTTTVQINNFTQTGAALCQKADKTIGYCSSVVAAGGTCTCN